MAGDNAVDIGFWRQVWRDAPGDLIVSASYVLAWLFAPWLSDGFLLAMVVAVLRQFIAGFWFHPIGVILGSSHMLEWSWGSILFAGVLRWVVLKLGGAATVKKKLMPLGAGLLIGAVLAFLCMNMLSAYAYAHDSSTTYGGLP
jgi:hypothetical protein